MMLESEIQMKQVRSYLSVMGQLVHNCIIHYSFFSLQYSFSAAICAGEVNNGTTTGNLTFPMTPTTDRQ